MSFLWSLIRYARNVVVPEPKPSSEKASSEKCSPAPADTSGSSGRLSFSDGVTRAQLARTLYESGRPIEEIARALEIPPSRVRRYLKT